MVISLVNMDIKLEEKDQIEIHVQFLFLQHMVLIDT